METGNRAPPARSVGRRNLSKAAAVLPKAVTDRTDRLVELSDHCDAALQLAEETGEDFLAYLLSMVIQETRTAMRRATMGVAAPAPKRRSTKSTS